MSDKSNDDVKQNNQYSENLVVQNIMRTEDGREYIYSYLQFCGVYESVFNKDPIQSGYYSGKRDAGLQLVRDIKESAPEYYIKMIEENING